MTDQYMSQQVFEDNKPTITTEVATILAAKGKTRKRFRIVALYEKSTGDLLAEVLRTSVGPVLAYRGIDWSGPGSEPVNGRTIAGYRRARKHHSIDPVTGDDSQMFQIKSRSIWYTISGKNLRERVGPDDLIAYN